MSVIILGIESSCDDTSAAVIKDGYLLSNVVSSQAVHEADGLNLRFRKLLETTPAEKAYMDKIKNGTLEKISIEQAKADGLNLTGSTKQVARYKLLDDNYNKTNLEGFDIGGINLLLVYSDVDGKNLVAIGFVELVAVQMESVSDTKGSMTLNFYFQKD